MTLAPIMYLNGRFVTADQAVLSPFDRGFLFAHAAYEVTAVLNQRLIDFKPHVTRLRRTLDQIDIPNPFSDEGWLELHQELISRNDFEEGLVYVQVSAGNEGYRDFAGRERLTPTIFLFADARPLIGPMAEHGISAVTLPDTRWLRRDLKTTQLLSQALAYRQARERGAVTAIMHEQGYVTEAASANVWIVTPEGQLITRNLGTEILPGITRAAVTDLLAGADVPLVEARFSVEALRSASEVFTSSAGALIAPVVSLDGAPIGSGRPGPVTRNIQRLYYDRMGADLGPLSWL